MALRRPGTIVMLALAALLAGLLGYGLARHGDDRTLDAAVRDGRRPQAPDHVLPRLDGRGQASLADFRGRVVVLNFWASWCTPCREEAPILERLARGLGDRARVVGVTYKDEPAASRAFARRYRLTYPILVDGRLDLASRYGTAALPETFVLDRRGRIVAIRRGQVTWPFLLDAVQQAER